MDALEDLLDDTDGRCAIYARHLDDGREIAVGPVEERFPTGSAAKALVLVAYAMAVEAGNVVPGSRVALDAAYRDARGGSGVLRHLDAGLAFTLEDLAVLMTIVSDNVATDLLLDALGGPDTVNAARSSLGNPDVEIASPTVWTMPPSQFGMASPVGLVQLWSRWHDRDPIARHCRRIAWRQQHREGFARFVPFSPDLVDFGLESPLGLWSKPGSYPSVSCEAGLFETKKAAWVLAVMARDLTDWGNGSANAGPTLRARASEVVYREWAP